MSFAAGGASLGVVSYCQAHSEADACLGVIQQGWLPLACVMLFLPGFYLGMAGVVFVLISEMIPLQVLELSPLKGNTVYYTNIASVDS